MILLSKLKRKAKLPPANLFFIEMLIVLLFFSFSAAVIIQIFAAADSKQSKSMLTEKSVICAQSIAEAYSVSGELSSTAEIVFGIDEVSDDAIIMLNDDFEAESDGKIILSLSESVENTAAGRLSTLYISFKLDESELYALSCKAYKTGGGDANG